MKNLESELLSLADELQGRYQKEGREALFRDIGDPDFSMDASKIIIPNDETATTRRVLNKSGSRLQFLLSENPNLHGVVINIIQQGGAEIWSGTFKGYRKSSSSKVLAQWGGLLPVAPILRRKNGELRISSKEGTSTVFSRYCGFPVSYYYLRSKNPKEHGIDSETQKKFKKLYAPMKKMYRKLVEVIRDDLRIYHGDGNHLHAGNLFVEYIDLQYYEKMIGEGSTVNTIPYSEEHFEFGLSEKVLDNPDEYKLIIRLGDFDQSEDRDDKAYEHWLSFLS